MWANKMPGHKKTTIFAFLLLFALLVSNGAFMNENASAADTSPSPNASPASAQGEGGSDEGAASATSTASQEALLDEIEQKEKQLKEIENKINTYENLVETKQKQQATLSNQLGIIEDQISQTQARIEKTAEEMKLVDLEIAALEIKIKEKDIDIQYNSQVLSELMKTVYYNSQSDTLELLLKYDNLGDYFTQIEHLNSLNSKTKDVLQRIDQAKAELQSKRDERKSEFEKLERLKSDNVKNKFYLESEQFSKEDLLEATKGEEEKYQELLKRVEQQRETLLGDISELSSQKEGELSQVRSQQKKPKAGLASVNWYYSQRDSRWADDTIGLSRTKMESYGCAVTSVAMVLRYHGVGINPGTLAKQRIFYHDLIVWPVSWQGVQRVSSISHGNIDWDVVDDELKNGNPVIIFVRANGRGAGHYVVVHHKDKNDEYIVHDPYWGPNMYLDSTRENISTLYGSSTSIDQMIIYHGSGKTAADADKEEESGSRKTSSDKTSASPSPSPSISPSKEDLCENSDGDWSASKKECKCPSGYELKKDECQKK